MVGTVLAASLGLVLAQFSWQAGIHGEARVLEDFAGDLVLGPHLALEYAKRDLAVQGRYAPQLVLREPSDRGTFQVMHQASLTGSLRLRGDGRVGLEETISAGVADLSWLASAPDSVPPFIVRGQDAPLADMITESTALSVALRLSNHVAMTASAGFSIAGGSDAVTQQSLPLTRTLRVSAEGLWLERRDSFSLALGASRGWASNAADTTTADATLAWRHAFTTSSERALAGEPPVLLGQRPEPRYEVELSAGVSVIGGDFASFNGAVPTVSLMFRRDELVRRPGELVAHVLLRYAPVLDGTTGALIPRGEASGALGVRLGGPFVASAGGGIGRTFGATSGAEALGDPPTLAQAGTWLTYEASQYVTLSAAARVGWVPDTEWAGVLTVIWADGGTF